MVNRESELRTHVSPPHTNLYWLSICGIVYVLLLFLFTFTTYIGYCKQNALTWFFTIDLALILLTILGIIYMLLVYLKETYSFITKNSWKVEQDGMLKGINEILTSYENRIRVVESIGNNITTIEDDIRAIKETIRDIEETTRKQTLDDGELSDEAETQTPNSGS